MLNILTQPAARRPHIADRMLARLLALPAATDTVIAVGGLAFAGYAHFVDRSPIESMIGLCTAAAFALLASFALVREIRLVRVLETHRGVDLDKQDRYDIEHLAIALFRVRGFKVDVCKDPVQGRAADLQLRRGRSVTLLRLRDWDDDQVGLGAVRALRAAVAESGASGGTLLHRRAFSSEALEFGRAKGLKLWLCADLLALVNETLGEQPSEVAPKNTSAVSSGRAPAPPVRPRQILFLDLRMLNHADGLAEWLMTHPTVELVATTEREDALSKVAAFNPFLSNRLSGTTPEVPVGSSQRYFEIQAYLSQNNLHGDMVRWLAVDTQANAFPCATPELLVAESIDLTLLEQVTRTLEADHA